MSSNGHLAASELTTVQGSIQLANDAAIDYFVMKAAAGIAMAVATPMGGYRTFAQQAALKANPTRYGSTLKSSQIAVAGSSTHGFGQRVDIVNDARAWTIANGALYGFTQRDPKNDPNCFTHAPGVHSTGLASTGSTTAVTPPALSFAIEGNQMLIMNRTQDNVIAVFDESHWQEIDYLASAASGTPLEVSTRFVYGLAHSLPVVPYDAVGWNYRSNYCPGLKRPLFVQNADGSLTPIVPAAVGGAPAIDHSAEILAAIAAIHVPAPLTHGTIDLQN